MTTALDDVRLIRDRALKIVRESGRPVTAGPLKLIQASLGDLKIILRTPFSGKSPEPVAPSYLHALVKQYASPSLPYGLDIFAPKKVLNVEWDANDELQVISFRRGDWEHQLVCHVGAEL
jgi:hypothetical protein